MENASKALIIAGAILLSILIIGLGMAVYNNASSSVGSANMDTQEISAHNSKFLSYNGRVKGSNVITLLNTIRNNNKEFPDRQITVSASETARRYSGNSKSNLESATYYLNGNAVDSIDKIIEKIKLSTTYHVLFDYSDDGLIQHCLIAVESAVEQVNTVIIN